MLHTSSSTVRIVIATLGLLVPQTHCMGPKPPMPQPSTSVPLARSPAADATSVATSSYRLNGNTASGVPLSRTTPDAIFPSKPTSARCSDLLDAVSCSSTVKENALKSASFFVLSTTDSSQSTVSLTHSLIFYPFFSASVDGVMPMKLKTAVEASCSEPLPSCSVLPWSGRSNDNDIWFIMIGSAAGVFLITLATACLVAVPVSFACKKRRVRTRLTKIVVDNPNYYIEEPSLTPYSREYDVVGGYGVTLATVASFPVVDYQNGTQFATQGTGYYEISASHMECVVSTGTESETPKGTTPDNSPPNTMNLSKESKNTDERIFFEESTVYWRPANHFEELYQQLSEMKYREIAKSDIRLLSHIGAGEFGMVRKGVWSSPAGDKEVAVKLLPDGVNEKDELRFLQEAAVNGQFNFHPNIVRLFGVVTKEKPFMMILELLANGDLRRFLHTQRAKLGRSVEEWPQSLLAFCRHVASGMDYLSSKGFVHRDLAARNVLVSKERVCKIADFGMSRDLDDETYYISQGGKIPVKWTAPEAIHFKKYSSQSDVWSYGALLYEIWSLGQKPFEDYTNIEVIRLIDTGVRLSPPPGCPRAMYQLMIKCWHPEKMSRPSFGEICQILGAPPQDLLFWDDEDSLIHPHACILGAQLGDGQRLYQDLQNVYRR